MDSWHKDSFLGFARLQLKHLQFDPIRRIDPRKVKRLVQNFESRGCCRSDVTGALPILIDPTILANVLVEAGVSRSTLLTVGEPSPMLHFSAAVKFDALDGRHRVEAAKRHLPAHDRWWMVALYDTKISATAIAKVLQVDKNATEAPDGRIIQSVLCGKDQDFVNLWLSRTGKSYGGTCNRLRTYDSGRLSERLQSLLRFKALQVGISTIGRWNPILEMRCYEEVEAYLFAIESTWTFILGTDVKPEDLDESTVSVLQMQTPAYSLHDRNVILKLFATHQVFPNLGDTTIRKRIAERTLRCKRILTFESFFDDFIYLRTCFDALVPLLPADWRRRGKDQSFRAAFAHHFGGKMSDFPIVYVDLWLLSQRGFPLVSDGKASRYRQSGNSVDSEVELRGFRRAQIVHFAHNSSFETNEIERLMLMHPASVPQDEQASSKPSTSSDDVDLRMKFRSGRPSRASHVRDRGHLHRVNVFDSSPVEIKAYATTYALAKDIVQCCWRPDLERWLSDSPAPVTRNGQALLGEITVSKGKLEGQPGVRYPILPEPDRRGGDGTTAQSSEQHFQPYESIVTDLPYPFPSTEDGDLQKVTSGESSTNQGTTSRTLDAGRNSASSEQNTERHDLSWVGRDGVDQHTDIESLHARVQRQIVVSSETSSLYSPFDPVDRQPEVEEAEQHIKSEYTIVGNVTNESATDTTVTMNQNVEGQGGRHGRGKTPTSTLHNADDDKSSIIAQSSVPIPDSKGNGGPSEHGRRATNFLKHDGIKVDPSGSKKRKAPGRTHSSLQQDDETLEALTSQGRRVAFEPITTSKKQRGRTRFLKATNIRADGAREPKHRA